MADLLNEIATRVASETGFVLGTDLFVNGFPAEQVDTAIALLDGAGTPANKKQLASIGQYDVQVISRARVAPTAKSRALLVQAALHEATGIDLGDWFLHYAEARQTPYLIGVDSAGRTEFIQHFLLRATEA